MRGNSVFEGLIVLVGLFILYAFSTVYYAYGGIVMNQDYVHMVQASSAALKVASVMNFEGNIEVNIWVPDSSLVASSPFVTAFVNVRRGPSVCGVENNWIKCWNAVGTGTISPMDPGYWNVSKTGVVRIT